MGERQMVQTFSFFARIARGTRQLAHLLKIGNRFLVLRQQIPHAPTPFIHWQQVCFVQGRGDALAHL